jgi:hypothetical protein
VLAVQHVAQLAPQVVVLHFFSLSDVGVFYRVVVMGGWKRLDFTSY